MSQEKEGNHQTSPSNNIMCEEPSSCKNTISNFSNPKMALNTNGAFTLDVKLVLK
jgi:hypothetical protein